MKDSKAFKEALKQKYNKGRSKHSSVRNLEVNITDPEQEKAKKFESDKRDLEKMEFFRSKKAKSGMPDSIRKQMLFKIREKMKKSSK